MRIAALDQALDPRQFGGKAFRLALAVRAGLPVPAGYALSCSFVQELACGDDHAVQELLEHFRGEVMIPAAVRSSAVGEDGPTSSYAGIYATFLNMTDTSGMQNAIREVVRASHSITASAYRNIQGKTAPAPVAVIVQKMVNAASSGVMFTRHPLTGADERVIEACWGLGESIASGRIRPDLYITGRGAAGFHFQAGHKETAVYPCAGGGTTEVRLDEKALSGACLTEEQIGLLDRLAVQCEQVFGQGLDIEWAFADDRLYLLQCRKITAIKH